MKKKITKLFPGEKEAMRLVEHGADIYDYTSARVLREVEKRHPKFISIGPAMMYKGDGTDRMPYFGAILTEAGRKALRG